MMRLSDTTVIYVDVVAWSEFPITPSYPHHPQGSGTSDFGYGF